VLAAVRRQTRFGAHLAEAIKDSELSLEAISTRLRVDHGIGVSPSVLTSWKRYGRLPRRTEGDQELIQALEQVLARPAGELWLSLERDRHQRKAVAVRGAVPESPPRRAARRPNAEEPAVDLLRRRMCELASSDDYVTTAVEERITIGRDRYEHLRRVRLTVRDVGEGRTDCYRLIYAPNSAENQLRSEWRCRIGRRIEGEKNSGLGVVELLFDRVLALGTSHTFGYVEVGARSGMPRTWVRRGIGHSSVDVMDMIVRFESPPARVFTCQWDQQGEPPTITNEVGLIDGTATLHLTKPAPGLYGLTWLW
jgi:hypothetical protein